MITSELKNINRLMKLTLVELESEIVNYAQKYYEGSPIVSDEEFDEAIELLRKMNPKSKILNQVGWGYKPNNDVSKLEKVNHLYQPITGISRKPRTIDDIPNDFKDSTLKRISAKLDGMTAVNYYEKGKLIKSITRGNGEVGLDITEKMRFILSRSNKELPTSFTGSVRGELIIPNNNWEEMNKKQKIGKNIRNYTAGIIKRNNVSSDLKYVNFVAYKVMYNGRPDIFTFKTIKDVNNFLRAYFDNVVDYFEFSLGNVQHIYLEQLYTRFCAKYLCDGLVITKININSKDEKELEYDEFAYKFKAESTVSEIIRIDWRLTRTGRYVPTAILEPVDLSGTQVSRASAYNAKYIKDNKLGVGSEIEIEKSGEIIPNIINILSPSTEDNILPENCPVCGKKLVWKETDLICDNPLCEGKSSSDLMMFTNLVGEVHGLGESIKYKFFDSVKVESLDDLLDKKDYIYDILMQKDTATNRKLKEMMDKIFYEKVNPVVALASLNIPRFGWNSCQKIVDSGLYKDFHKINTFNSMTLDLYLEKIEHVIGRATRLSIEKNHEKIKRLVQFEIIDRYEDIKLNEKKDEFIPVVITGKLSVKRKDFEEFLNKNGYEITSNIKNAKYLITDNPNSGSSKNKNADKYGIKKISEEEIRKIIGGESIEN